MSLTGEFHKRTFHFGFDARTSRGAMKDKTSWFVRIWNTSAPGTTGVGECGPLPGLSIDDRPELEAVIRQGLEVLEGVNHLSEAEVYSFVRDTIPVQFPSVRFAFETALLDLLHGGWRMIYENDFIRGKSIPINGLIWMGEEDFMLTQVRKKLEQGFRCIKLKVGGLDFERECRILEKIRTVSPADTIIRLDANGAFDEQEALQKLNTLAAFSIQSIEQPLKPGSTLLESLCRTSPIPIALDEELIGQEMQKRKLLEHLKPQYIVLKPTLHGGLYSCAEWINVAEELNIGWWITSALESSIGLNAICQFTSNYTITTHQGLGTGQIYTDNILSPLEVGDGHIRYNVAGEWSPTGL